MSVKPALINKEMNTKEGKKCFGGSVRMRHFCRDATEAKEAKASKSDGVRCRLGTVGVCPCVMNGPLKK